MEDRARSSQLKPRVYYHNLSIEMWMTEQEVQQLKRVYYHNLSIEMWMTEQEVHN